MHKLLFQKLGVVLINRYDEATCIPSKQLVGHLMVLIMLCTDLEDAFADFSSLIKRGTSLTSADRCYLLFDAHVTDCGCHLRAQMIQEVFISVQEDCEIIAILDVLLAKLRELKGKCISLTQLLCCENTSPQKLGLCHTIRNHDEVFSMLKWDTSDAVDKSKQFNPKNIPQTQEESSEIEWNVKRLEVLLEFIYCSHFLSKYKTYKKNENKDSVTIDFNYAFERRQEILSEFHLLDTAKSQSGCRYLKHAKQSKNKFISLVCHLQSRLAQFSISFLKQKSKLSLEIDTLLRKSPKNISAVPNFLHFLVLEKEWSQKGTPILLAVRKFQQDKHFDIYFDVRIHPESLEWTLEEKKCDEFEVDIPYVVISAVIGESLPSKTSQQLTTEIKNAQKNFREFWMIFMSQHKQYPFDVECCEDLLLKEKLPKNIYDLYHKSKSQDIAQIVFKDSTTLVPKHIFTEYPSTFFDFQKATQTMNGVLVI